DRNGRRAAGGGRATGRFGSCFDRPETAVPPAHSRDRGDADPISAEVNRPYRGKWCPAGLVVRQARGIGSDGTPVMNRLEYKPRAKTTQRNSAASQARRHVPLRAGPASGFNEGR